MKYLLNLNVSTTHQVPSLVGKSETIANGIQDQWNWPHLFLFLVDVVDFMPLFVRNIKFSQKKISDNSMNDKIF